MTEGLRRGPCGEEDLAQCRFNLLRAPINETRRFDRWHAVCGDQVVHLRGTMFPLKRYFTRQATSQFDLRLQRLWT